MIGTLKIQGELTGTQEDYSEDINWSLLPKNTIVRAVASIVRCAEI